MITMVDQIALIIALACCLLIVIRAADARACAVIAGLCVLFVLIGADL